MREKKVRSSGVVTVIAVLMFATQISSGADKHQQQQQQQSGMAWAQAAMQALTGGNPVSSISESGTVTWSFGNNQGSGSITMQSTGYTNSQISLTTSAGNHYRNPKLGERRQWARRAVDRLEWATAPDGAAQLLVRSGLVFPRIINVVRQLRPESCLQ